MFIYAQLNNDNLCIGVSSLKDEVIDPKMIRLETFDPTLIGKTYDNGVWI